MAFRGRMQQQFPGGGGAWVPATGGSGGERSGREGREHENLARTVGMASSAIAHADPATGAKGILACGELKTLEVSSEADRSLARKGHCIAYGLQGRVR